jgi:hypothetical protein
VYLCVYSSVISAVLDFNPVTKSARKVSASIRSMSCAMGNYFKPIVRFFQPDSTVKHCYSGSTQPSMYPGSSLSSTKDTHTALLGF